MQTTDIWDMVGMMGCGLFCLFLLVALLIIKQKQKKEERLALRKKTKTLAQSDDGSRNIDSYHVYTWQEGDGEGIADPPSPKSPYLRGADEKAEAWADFAARHGIRPFGSDSADAVDRARDQAEYKAAWDAAHDQTVKNGPEVIDTQESQNHKKDWH